MSCNLAGPKAISQADADTAWLQAKKAHPLAQQKPVIHSMTIAISTMAPSRGPVGQRRQMRRRAVGNRPRRDKRPTPAMAALPIPFAGVVLNPVVLSAAWAYGAYRFWNNYSQTTYTDEGRLKLTALWPVLWIVSATFRSNFNKAIKG